ncbi:MAG TPA: cupin domain-containing protein [Steroidobacteraceae bacterium]|nr:cupin domain-containing protein [Steroidobacteraceae bacterium]
MNKFPNGSPGVTLLEARLAEPEVDRPRAERLVNGNPQRTTWNVYANPSGEVFAGIWSSEVGSWRIEMGPGEDEFFFVVQGRCHLIGDGAAPVEAGPGQSLVIPAGFKGIFEVVEPMTKHYMIVDRKGLTQ